MTGMRSGADVRGFYQALGVELPGWAQTEASVRCFADPDSHEHQDRDPSCSVNLDSGAFNCHRCGAHGGAYDAALATGRSPRAAIDLMIAHGLTDRRPRNNTSQQPSRTGARSSSSTAADHGAMRSGSQQPTHPESLRRHGRGLDERTTRLREWSALLHGNRELLERLRDERGWESGTLRELSIGFDGARITVPVTDERRSVQGVLRLRVEDSQRPKVLAAPGTRLGLIPHPALEPRRALLLVEGPSDMLAARSAGLPAIAVPGTYEWRGEWAHALVDRAIAVAMDCDRPGRQAALRIANDLERNRATRVQIIDLAPSRDDGYDLSDWLHGGNQQLAFTARAYTSEQYRRILEAADRTNAASAGPSAAKGSATPTMAAGATHAGVGRSHGCARF